LRQVKLHTVVAVAVAMRGPRLKPVEMPAFSDIDWRRSKSLMMR
jgi:hypothetical protein